MKNNIFYGTPCDYSIEINGLVTAGRFVLADEGVLLPAPVVVPLVGFLIVSFKTVLSFAGVVWLVGVPGSKAPG